MKRHCIGSVFVQTFSCICEKCKKYCGAVGLFNKLTFEVKEEEKKKEEKTVHSIVTILYVFVIRILIKDNVTTLMLTA